MDRTTRKPPSSGPDATTRVSRLPTTGVPEDRSTDSHLITPGLILGERYRIEAMLGRGGMGEVWRAYDLKLRIEVALKALRLDRIKGERGLELIRNEVLAARAVLSPNVCRIFDLVVAGGHDLVSMEYIDGRTLIDLLRAHGPLAPREAAEIASQFLAGLEAIHGAGLVHRDVKPENIMITRSGRVVLMDFGLARHKEEGRAGSAAGTPAYMAPEQFLGETADPRADIFSAGVVLAEMTSPEGVRDRDSRESLHRGVHRDPPVLPDSPWLPVISQAVAKEPAGRFASAGELTRALQDIALRVSVAEEKKPYPGLAFFREEDAEFFFGRELEVEAVWKKLRQPHLMGLIGPSGAGKSSFLRAGLIPAKPDDWRIVVCTPGTSPFGTLAEQLVAEFAGDEEAVRQLVRFDDIDVAMSLLKRWRGRHGAAMIIVDQFEELFTQNPPEVQARFIELASRLPLEADVFVLLSMRDDFLMECHAYPALSPMLSELTLLGSPTGSSLRRALEQPALLCGYRFEDEALIEEMLEEVEGERGALPLLAFALSQLWERRDRDTGRLTRTAYREIGGVSGALASHAEATLERIGSENEPILREIFRNLVTAQGTRAARDREELLSVFRERKKAETVLQGLTDSRLLTSFEIQTVEGKAETSSQQVEIVHESLLAAWPRLARWQTQEAGSAQLRDQLRQAARSWRERGRPVGLLWVGAPYWEFLAWRERYPGGLSETEEAFARAMVSHANRRRRRRRLALTAAFAFVVAVAGGLGILWRGSVLETRRAEAQKLIALGQVQLDEFPPAALAYARVSLELTDTAEARRLALEALWRGGGARFLEIPKPMTIPVFSPDGRWMVATGLAPMDKSGGQVHVYSQEGGPPVELPIDGRPVSPAHLLSDGTSLVVATLKPKSWGIQIFSFPEGRDLRKLEAGPHVFPTPLWALMGDADELITVRRLSPGGQLVVSAVPFDGGEPRELRRLAVGAGQGADFHPERRLVAYGRGRDLAVANPLDGTERMLGTIDTPVRLVFFAQGTGDRLVATDQARNLYVLSLERGLERKLKRGLGSSTDTMSFLAPSLDPAGRWFTSSTPMGPVYQWDLDGPPDALPHVLRPRPEAAIADASAIDPRGRWQVVSRGRVITFRPLERPQVHVLPFAEGMVWGMEFTPDGRRLVVRAPRRLVVVPLVAGIGDRSAIDLGTGFQLDVHPDGRSVATTESDPNTRVGRVLRVPLDGTSFGEPIELVSARDVHWWPARFDPSGRFLVAAQTSVIPPNQHPALDIIDLETREVRTCPLVEGDASRRRNNYEGGIVYLDFASDGTFFTFGDGGVRRWDLETCASELVYGHEGFAAGFLSRDGRFMLHAIYDMANWKMQDPGLIDLETGVKSPLPGGQDSVSQGADFDPEGRMLAVSHMDGAVRVSSLPDGQPHLLIGHEGAVNGVAVSPDGRWIASLTDTEIRLWPTPDVSRPPFQTLSHDELMAKLATLTNLRAVRDPAASTGWSLEIGPFPGWADLPEW